VRHFALAAITCMVLLSPVTANANISFSDVSVVSDFGQYSVFSMSTNGYFDSIFFRFTGATVGDDDLPLRSGQITIEYTAQADTGKLLDGINLRAVGNLQGTGTIEADGLVEDLAMPGFTTSSDISLSNSVQFPYLEGIAFIRPTTSVHVTQTFLLEANDGAGFDLANLNLVVHQLTQIPLPEPSSLGLLLLGGLAVMKRR
jgi:hypothetical protein